MGEVKFDLAGATALILPGLFAGFAFVADTIGASYGTCRFDASMGTIGGT